MAGLHGHRRDVWRSSDEVSVAGYVTRLLPFRDAIAHVCERACLSVDEAHEQVLAALGDGNVHAEGLVRRYALVYRQVRTEENPDPAPTPECLTERIESLEVAFWLSTPDWNAGTAQWRLSREWAHATAIKLSRADLDLHFPAPTRAEEKTAASAAAEKRCREWLTTLTRMKTGTETKADLLASALHEFPGLSARGFERAWESSAPAERKRPGRARKS